MGISDISGIFSRFFITGFFLPSFFVLSGLWLFVSDELLPADLKNEHKGAQILVLGGLAVLIGLAALGLRFPIIRLFEGYPLRGRAGRFLIPAQCWSYQRLKERNPTSVGTKWRLDRRFPTGDTEENNLKRLLPTRFGNIIRAAEDHAYSRWGLDHIAVWPRVDPLLNEREQELHSNARSDLFFYVNSALGSIVIGVVLVIDQAVYGRLSGAVNLVYAIPFALAYVLYRMSLSAAEGWGLEMRASVDLHHLDLYDKLGVRRPLTPEDEKKTIAPAVNAFLLTGKALPSEIWAKSDEQKGATNDRE
jgi:hypothetical protein